jgi:hypothetical protein
MALTYNFENPIKTLQKSKIHDLAVVDTEGYAAFDADATQLVTNNILIFSL